MDFGIPAASALGIGLRIAGGGTIGEAANVGQSEALYRTGAGPAYSPAEAFATGFGFGTLGSSVSEFPAAVSLLKQNQLSSESAGFQNFIYGQAALNPTYNPTGTSGLLVGGSLAVGNVANSLGTTGADIGSGAIINQAETPGRK